MSFNYIITTSPKRADVQNLVGIDSAVTDLRMREKKHVLCGFFINISICLSVPSFVGTTGHSFGAILTLNDSNDVISQPLVPFGGHYFANRAPGVFSFALQLSTRHCSHLLLSAVLHPRAAAPLLWAPVGYRSITPARTALSSKPAAHRGCGHMIGQTDRQFHYFSKVFNIC